LLTGCHEVLGRACYHAKDSGLDNGDCDAALCMSWRYRLTSGTNGVGIEIEWRVFSRVMPVKVVFNRQDQRGGSAMGQCRTGNLETWIQAMTNEYRLTPTIGSFVG